MHNNLDTLAAIKFALAEGKLKELVDKRRKYVKDTGDRLSLWILFKGFVLSHDGGIGKIEDYDTKSFPERMNDVVDLDSFLKVCDSKFYFSEMTLPSSEEVCPECGTGWKKNVFDFKCTTNYHDNTMAWRHKSCFNIYNRNKERQFFTEVFADAGFKCVMNEIPNQYHAKDDLEAAPWFDVTIPEGSITIGWRKSVIAMEYKGDASLNFEELFKDQKVTKGEAMIHAWGKEKAIEYLKVIKAELKNVS